MVTGGTRTPAARIARVLRLAGSLAFPLLAGALGGWATAQGVGDWYPTLAKPSFNPPAWLFGPVWTALYLLMGLSVFLVWEKGLRSPGVPAALGWFGVQLGLNALWSFLFFGAQAPGWAFLELILLWGAILTTMVLFFRVRPVAGWLLTPYLVWVTFAGVLNLSIWILNR